MIRIWKITDTAIEEMHLAGQNSLDAITRQLPEGYYSTFRTYDGGRRVLGMAAHLRRLYDPVTRSDVSASTLRRQLLTLLEPYRLDEARVRVMMTKGGDAFIAIEPLKPIPREVYERGVHVETTGIQRESPRLKSTAFIGMSAAERKHIAREGIFEALMVRNGRILEGMTSNFFYVGQVGNLSYMGTAREHILLGITRRTVIRVARGRGLEVRYRALRLDQLPAVSEAFLTSSSRGVVPIVQIDDLTIGQGRPGPITKEVSAAYEAYVIAKAERL